MTNPKFLSLGFNWGNSDDPSTFRKLTVSRQNTPKWLTIPWDGEPSDPENQHYVNPDTGAGGWSILTGPCHYMITAHVRIKGAEKGCSTHVQLRYADLTDTSTPTWLGEAPEWFVGPKESSNTHLHGSWVGYLPAGKVAQVALDYWNAGQNSDGSFKPQSSVYAWLVGASVSALYWRPEEEISS